MVVAEFQIVAIEGQDLNDEYTVTIYGRTAAGESAAVSTLFAPYFFVKVPQGKSCKSFELELKSLNSWHEKRDGETYPITCVPVQRKDLWGFRNGLVETFITVEFKSLKRMRQFASSCKYKKYEIFESNIEPVLRFMHRTGIQSTGWISASGVQAELTTAKIDMFCKDWKELKPVENDRIAPLVISSFDIECYSSTGKFPDPEVPGDVVFQVAFTTKVYGSTDPPTQKCFCLKETPGHEWFETEKELLEAVVKYIHEIDFDILTGWNIFGFDLEYIFKRMEYCKCSPNSFYMGRRLYEMSALVQKNLASSALGQNVLKMVPMPGRFVFDLFQTIKAEHKLDSYSLNNVSKEFLKDNKLDMPIKELFGHYASGDHVKLAEVADYCIKDTELPIKIMNKLYTIENLIEMAKATWVPLNYLVERGQQIKVFSQIAKKARELHYLIPVIDKKNETSKYEGATVLDASTGAYYKPITALDFASLYPSIMDAHNLCYSTLVMNQKYDNLPDVEYETHGDHRFAQNVPSVLPAILRDLRAFRKKAKKDMEAHKGTPMYHVYNGKQLAYKISMNSVYGFTGASNGILPCLAIASTVTAQGRTMIQMSKDYVERHFEGAQVRYGDTDSIMVEFDTQGRTGAEAIEYSWELGERASAEITAIFKKPNELELEKIYCPYFLYSKKRYAAKMWVKNKKGEMELEKIDVKGLQVVRRDTCEYVRDTCEQILNKMLDMEDPGPYIEERKTQLLSGNVPMEQLILSKRLGDSYKSANLAHVRVRDKIKEREPGSEPRSGDRVQFVLVKGNKKDKMYEKAEDPTWVKQHNLPIDYEYYFKHQFETPVTDLVAI